MAALDAVVVGISGQDVESHREFTTHHGLTVPLLADPDKAVARATASRPVLGTQRATFVIVVAIFPAASACSRLIAPPRNAAISRTPIARITGASAGSLRSSNKRTSSTPSSENVLGTRSSQRA